VGNRAGSTPAPGTKASSKEEAFFVLFTSKKVKLFLQLTVLFAF
jgi:hypothetical protein